MSRLRRSGQTPFLTPGHPLGVAVCPTANMEQEFVAVTVFNPAEHALDFGPTAALDRERVAALHAALGEWLRKVKAPRL